jgi:serine/threonine protein kinase
MARLIEPPGADGPVNEAERLAVEILARRLPETYTVIPNVVVAQAGGQRFEYDVIVVAPHGVYVVEVKGWQGRLRGDRFEWLLNGRRRRNPMLTTERKAKVLKSRLVDHVQALGRVRVEAVVVLVGERLSVELTAEGTRMVVRLPDLIPLLTDPSAIGQESGVIVGLTPKVCEAILHRTMRRERTLRFRDYEVLDTLEQSEDEALYRARRGDLRGAPEVHLRVVTLSPYLLGEEQRRERIAHLYREAEAFSRMGPHPNVVGPRDVFQDDDGRVVLVLDAEEGRSLRQRLADGTPLTVEERLNLLADVCRGLVHAHAHGVIHRLVTPMHVHLTEDGRGRLADFEFAKLPVDGTPTVWQLDAVGQLDQAYLAPELRSPALGAAGPATDLYGLGRIAWELFTGASVSDLESPATTSPPAGMPADLVELVRKLLQEHPAARLGSALEALKILERLLGSGELRVSTGPRDQYGTGDLIDGEFEVRGRLGTGGFRSVYRVYRALNDHEFALKVFNTGGFDAVRREIAILQEIEHPNIERVVWADQTSQGQWYLVTRLIDGEPLTDYARGVKRLSVEEAIQIGDQLLAALESIHPDKRRIDELLAASRERSLSAEEGDELLRLRASGIVHRDVKPQNILLTRDGAVLIDFNIASPAESEVQTLSGTPRYQAPDAGLLTWNPSVDLFSAGVTLYELICHHHPYEHDIPNASRRPIDPRTFRADLSEDLTTFLVKACAPLADQRFRSAAEMRADLADIGNPLAASPSPDTGAIAQRLSDLLKDAPANVNPMVTELLGLSSQARRSNSETRGLTDLARSTYVQTKLDHELTEAVLAGRHRLVVVTGNAGDGKTAFIQQVEAEALTRDARQEAHGPNGSVIALQNGTVLRTLYDGSQDEEDKEWTSDEVLADFLVPFAVDGNDDGAIRLAAINEGRLRDFIGFHRQRFLGLIELLAELDDPGHGGGDEQLILVNLNLRSVTTGGNQSIFSQQVEAIVDAPFWTPCQTCEHRSRCPIKHNVDTFADPVSGDEVTERLRRLVDVVRLRRTRHLTMRDVRSLISHVLFRDRDCYEIAQLLTAGDEMAIADLAYFQASGRAGIPPDTKLERGAELLAEIDVADVTNPADDRILANRKDVTRMRFPRRESDYPHEAVAHAYEEAGIGYEAEPAQVRRAHAAMRRLAYFERRDHGWIGMLPYRQLQELERVLDPDGVDARADLRDRLLQALCVAQGISRPPQPAAALWLTAGDGAGAINGFRRLPATDFELHIVRQDLPYVESQADRLDLVHVPSGTALPVDLDVLALLDRLREGYVPSMDEGRGLLVHIELFLNRLRALRSTELVLVTDDNLWTISARTGGVVELSEVLP